MAFGYFKGLFKISPTDPTKKKLFSYFRYVKGVSFSMEGNMKGLPFLSKMVCKRVLISGGVPPY